MEGLVTLDHAPHPQDTEARVTMSHRQRGQSVCICPFSGALWMVGWQAGKGVWGKTNSEAVARAPP